MTSQRRDEIRKKLQEWSDRHSFIPSDLSCLMSILTEFLDDAEARDAEIERLRRVTRMHEPYGGPVGRGYLKPCE